MATRTVANSGGNYNSVGTWVEGAIPTSADDVVFTATSGPLTINVASNCKSINFTNYTNTLTATSTLTVSGSVTLVSAMTISGTGTLIVDSTSTLTSNGKTWTGSLTFQTTVTHTLADDWIVSGNLLVGIAAQIPTINGFSISVGGSLSSTSVGNALGTTNVILNGTGTWSWSSAGCFFPITINTVGTITISNVSIGANFVHVAGTVVTTGSTLRLNAATYSITSNTIIWNNVILGTTTAFTTTLNDNLNINGNLTIGANFNTQTVNGNNINLSGSLSSSAYITNLTGTTVLNFVGTGTWSGTSTIKSNVNINTAGTLTISGTVTYDTRILTYTAGTIITTGSTLIIGGACTLDTSGMTWNNVSFSGSGTRTLLSNLTCNTLGVSGGVSTTNGFNIYFNNLSYNTTAGTIGLGTTTFRFNGTGSWTHTTTGRFNNNLIIDCGAGTLTVTGAVYIANGSITYLSGTVNQASGSLTLAGSSIIKTSGIEWLFVYMNGSINTFNETFRAKTLSSNGFSVLTFAGTHGFEVENFFVINGLNITVTLVNGVRYLVKQSLVTNIPGYTRLFTCASGAALLDLQYGATQNLANTSATRINSLGGQTIYTTGTLTSTQNWNVGTYRNPTDFMIMF